MKLRTGVVCLLPIISMVLAGNGLCAERTELISRSSAGEIGNSNSSDPSISSDARYIVYESSSRNLVEDKTSSRTDIFLHDRQSDTTSRISIADEEGDGDSNNAEISADGNVIVFSSVASNLVSDDDEGNTDIFAYDRAADTLTRVSVDSNGVAGDGSSDNADVSGDGRYVVFQSAATNLVDDDLNEKIDIFRHDRQSGETVRVNFDFLDEEVIDWDSTEPVISDNGRYVAFQTQAVLVPCDDNNGMDVYLRDMVDNLTTHGSRTNWGCVPNSSSFHPVLSGDGRYLGFSSSATNLLVEEDNNSESDFFLRDLQDMTTERVSIAGKDTEGDGRSVGYGGSISSSGQYVVFSSPATNFDAKDGNEAYDIFARDRTESVTTRESVGTYWEEGTGDSGATTAVISADGKYIVFDSNSSELVPGDNNGRRDIFIREYLYDGPLITGLEPKAGDFKGGTLLTISGNNFDADATVTIDDIPALNVVVNGSGTMITCITPAHDVGTVELKVTNSDGTSWIYPIGRGVFNGYIYRPLTLPFLNLLSL